MWWWNYVITSIVYESICSPHLSPELTIHTSINPSINLTINRQRNWVTCSIWESVSANSKRLNQWPMASSTIQHMICSTIRPRMWVVVTSFLIRYLGPVKPHTLVSSVAQTQLLMKITYEVRRHATTLSKYSIPTDLSRAMSELWMLPVAG